MKSSFTPPAEPASCSSNSRLFPGLLPTIALGALLAAVFVIPLVAVTLAGAALLVTPWSV